MTANCIANRFGVNNNSTGATLQRTDRPPISIRNISFSFKVGNQLVFANMFFFFFFLLGHNRALF
jgi:hypothetical protein